MDWVIKIGGSLFPERAIELCESIIALNNSSEPHKKILIICGGGEFANKIREYDQVNDFSSIANHNSAMNVCGYNWNPLS